MKRFVSFTLIVAVIAAVVLMPIGEARAETPDGVRKRALAELAKRSKGDGRLSIIAVTGPRLSLFGAISQVKISLLHFYPARCLEI